MHENEILNLKRNRNKNVLKIFSHRNGFPAKINKNVQKIFSHRPAKIWAFKIVIIINNEQIRNNYLLYHYNIQILF
jgi:hypothetical protein